MLGSKKTNNTARFRVAQPFVRAHHEVVDFVEELGAGGVIVLLTPTNSHQHFGTLGSVHNQLDIPPSGFAPVSDGFQWKNASTLARDVVAQENREGFVRVGCVEIGQNRGGFLFENSGTDVSDSDAGGSLGLFLATLEQLTRGTVNRGQESERFVLGECGS
jgi:hypothetical protein